jgi:hypothetical protein
MICRLREVCCQYPSLVGIKKMTQEIVGEYAGYLDLGASKVEKLLSKRLFTAGNALRGSP